MVEIDFRVFTDVIIRVGAVILIVLAIILSIRVLGLVRKFRAISDSVLEKTQFIDHIMSLPLVLLTKWLEQPGSSVSEEKN